MIHRLQTLTRTLVLGALAATAMGGAAAAQASFTQATGATGTIFQPILVAKTSDLSFGTVVRPVSGTGTVVIAASDGARTLTGSGALLNTGPNAAASRAAYTVTGEGGQSFSIGVPANFSMTRTGGAQTILVTLTPTATTGLLSGVLGATGTLAIGVGGSMPISDATASGAYVGTFNMIVTYN